jgi:hypothetical protein
MIKFVSCKWDTFEKDNLKLYTQSINCVYNPLTKDTQISRSKKDYSGYTFTGNSQFYEWTLIDSGLFIKLWDIVGSVGVAIIDEANPNMPLLDKYTNTSISLMDELRGDEKEAVLDIPYLQLAGWETSVLPAAFQLHGNRYILTPQSKRLGLQKLDEEFTSLYRGSHLFEACDMGYVNSRRNTINKLRTALTQST